MFWIIFDIFSKNRQNQFEPNFSYVKKYAEFNYGIIFWGLWVILSILNYTKAIYNIGTEIL